VALGAKAADLDVDRGKAIDVGIRNIAVDDKATPIDRVLHG